MCAWGTFQKFYRGVLRLGKTLKLENYPNVAVIESTCKTFLVPKDRLDAQFYTIFRSHFVNTYSACVAIHLPLLCKKFVLKHFCDLFESKIENFLYYSIFHL